MLETTTNGNEEIGIFPAAPVDQSKNNNNGDDDDDDDNVMKTPETVKQLVISDGDRVAANRYSNNIKQSVSEQQNDCERNVVYRKFSISDEKVSFNWTTGDVALPKDSNFVNFR